MYSLEKSLLEICYNDHLVVSQLVLRLRWPGLTYRVILVETCEGWAGI